MLIGGLASATPLTDLSKDAAFDGITYTAETGLFTGSVYYASQSKVQSNTSITLNLTDLNSFFASNAEQVITLVNVNMETDVSLVATASGLEVYQGGVLYKENKTVSYQTLQSDESLFVANDGDTYITLTFAQVRGEARIYTLNSKVEGVVNGETTLVAGALYSESSMTTSALSTFENIYVNSDYITAVEFSNAWPTNGTAENFQLLTGALNDSVKTVLLPEPATATLSLLALCGLAARRRRR